MTARKLTEGMSASVTYTPAPRPSDVLFHTITLSGKGANQEIFLDYFRLKGVTSMEVRMVTGDVPRVTIELIVAGAAFVGTEKD